MSSVVLTSEQDQGVGLATTALLSGRNFAFGGYAGTGKTTSAKTIVKRLEDRNKRVAVMAPTGKAANVLRKKGLVASTIHRKLYFLDESKQFQLRQKHELKDFDVFLIDEASMISTELYEDLLYFDKPILFMGDPGQLEPVGSDAKLMHNPDFVLKKIHRTAETSHIIQFATKLRTSVVHPNFYGAEFTKANPKSESLVFRSSDTIKRSEWLAFDQIIVGKNATRAKINAMFKKSQGFLPVKDDKVIVLRNNYEYDVFNGETFLVHSTEIGVEAHTGEPTVELISDDGRIITVPIWAEFFSDYTLHPRNMPKGVVWLDYAYAITCHKSQGSEWDNVAVIDEAFGTPPNRWRYTAATRAAEKLTWIKHV